MMRMLVRRLNFAPGCIYLLTEVFSYLSDFRQNLAFRTESSLEDTPPRDSITQCREDQVVSKIQGSFLLQIAIYADCDLDAKCGWRSRMAANGFARRCEY